MSLSHPSVRAVIFDISGTVLDYGSRGPVAAVVALFQRNGVDVTEEEARRSMGAPVKDHIQAVAGEPEVSARWASTHGAAVMQDDLDRLWAEFVPLQIEVLRDHCDVIPGVPELTAALRGLGIGFANTTSFDSNMMVDMIRLAEEGGYCPDIWVSPDMAGGGRPAPWMAFHAATHMGVYPMSQIVKVGGTLADVDEAHAAGMWAVSVVRHGNEVGLSQQVLNALPRSESTSRIAAARDRLAVKKAHYIIDATADLMPVLEEISWRISRGERP